MVWRLCWHVHIDSFTSTVIKHALIDAYLQGTQFFGYRVGIVMLYSVYGLIADKWVHTMPRVRLHSRQACMQRTCCTDRCHVLCNDAHEGAVACDVPRRNYGNSAADTSWISYRTFMGKMFLNWRTKTCANDEQFTWINASCILHGSAGDTHAFDEYDYVRVGSGQIFM